VFSKIINEFVRTIPNDLAKIYYFSDDVPQQYKNFKNFVKSIYYREEFWNAR